VEWWGLDELLEKGRDLFSPEEGHAHSNGEGSQIFSILPQKSILVDATGHEGEERPKGNRADSLLVDGIDSRVWRARWVGVGWCRVV